MTVLLGLVLFVGSQAYADVVGRLHFSVKNGDDEKPIANAVVLLRDAAGVRPDIKLTTDVKGDATTGQIDAHAWHYIVSAKDFVDSKGDATVVADTTSDVDVDMDSSTNETVIHVKANKATVTQTNTQAVTERSGDFTNKTGGDAGDRQSLTKVLRTAPGAAEDSYGQLHIRGEHSATSFYLDGWRLPGAFQGRIGQLVDPAAIQNIDFITGGFAPEYGGDTAAVLNLQLRAGTIEPFTDFYFDGGSYNTFEGGLTMGGQLGEEYGLPDDKGKKARRFTYLFDFSGRSTDNAVEPPQPNNQTAHNFGDSYTGFGNLTYHASDRDSLSLVLARNPAKTDVANRTGLPIWFAQNDQGQGQGYGFLGGLTQAQAQAEGIGSQQDDGQDIWQTDINEFVNLSWRRTINDHLSSILSFGLNHDGLDVSNANPAIDLNRLMNDPTYLPDNSIEYNPTIHRNSHSIDAQGSLTYSEGAHTAKVGFSIEQEHGNESYELDPASQLALQDLQALGLTSLVPTMSGMEATTNVVRTGYYDAAYLQDTWRITPKFTANYGARLDVYQQTEGLTANNGTPASSQSEFVDKLSPRFNFSYALTPKTIARASYDKLFIEPPIAQGSILGSQIKPEVLDQYDVSIERELTTGQKVKLAYYYKEIQNQIDTGLLVPGTQIGVFTSVNFNEGHVRGTELSYELSQRGDHGWSGFASWANTLAKPTGLDNTGGAVPLYNDHDQLNTISAGVAYTFKDKSFAGIDFQYGSGFTSSSLQADGLGPRASHTEVDLRYSSRPIAGHLSLTFAVENLFNETAINNFNSGFSGTRFQQGRRILVGFTGKF